VKRQPAVQIALACAALLVFVSGLALSPGVATPFDDLGSLALALAVIMAAALGGGHVARRLGQPAVLGELLAGILLGNLPGVGLLSFIGASPFLDILSRVGMLLLLFEVGLDLSVRELLAVGPSSLLVALIGTVSSLVLGSLVAALLMPGAPDATHFFLGAAITATSVGITARVLRDLGASRSAAARIILGASVLDDVLALVVLGSVTAWVSARHADAALQASSVLALVMKTTGFLVLAILLGVRLTPTWFRQAARLRTRGALLAVGLCFCFFLSWATSAIGLGALVGSFAAGLVLEDRHSELFVKRGELPLADVLQPMIAFLVPVFFVLVGYRTRLGALWQPGLLAASLALTGAAIGGKLSAAAGVLDRTARKLTVAIGMVPRGEVTLVFAALGGALRVGHVPLLDDRGYAALVTVVVLTTLATPPALKWSLRAAMEAPEVTKPAA
jgi:Kef-type K+ transport system membrane component KefB